MVVTPFKSEEAIQFMSISVDAWGGKKFTAFARARNQRTFEPRIARITPIRLAGLSLSICATRVTRCSSLCSG
jgi:hypothetical protein